MWTFYSARSTLAPMSHLSSCTLLKYFYSFPILSREMQTKTTIVTKQKNKSSKTSLNSPTMFLKSKRRWVFFKAANTCIFLNAVSAQPSWFNGHRFRVWCKPALMAVSGSCTDDNPKTSPTYERRWLAQGFSDWSKPQQICESLDENLTWLAIHGRRTCVTCTELQSQQSGMGPGPKRGPPGFQWGIHCALFHSFAIP